MPTHRRSTASLATQALSLASSVPFVMGTRIARAAAMGHQPSVADQKEFTLMFSEKAAAAMESSWAMAWSMMQAQQRMWLAGWGMWLRPWNPASMQRALGDSGHAAWLQAMDRGLRPYSRRAAANATRLRRLSARK